MARGPITANGLILPKTYGAGILTDADGTPAYGWKDLVGPIHARASGSAALTFAAYRDGIYQFQMDTTSREAHLEFHIPHDIYIPAGSGLFIHTHWSLAAAGGTGNAVFTYDISYAKGYNQAAFSTAVVPTVTQAASGTAYQHMIAEVQFTADSPSATQINNNVIEVDGLILVRCRCTTLPTGTGGAPFIHFIDIHYQSSQIATKGRNYPFYT